VASLDGEIATLRFNPNDPASVQQALREMEQALESKTAAYSSNALVAKIAEEAKEAFRKRILEAKHENT
jgi:hypothetical protein